MPQEQVDSSRSSRAKAEAAAQEGQKIQKKIDKIDKSQNGKPKDKQAMQAGAREYPVPPSRPSTSRNPARRRS